MKNYNGLTDEMLALRYVEGDNKAFDELLTRNQQKLYNYILFVVRDPELANDVFQDTFVKVITKLQEGKYTDRQQKSEHMVETGADNDLSKLKSEDLMDGNRETEFVNAQIMSDVRNIMNALPAAQREVVYMRFYQDLSFKEIAQVTGVSINTSLGRMRYALINMRRIAKQHQIQLNMEL